jgi:hypothetical protein
VTGRRPSRGQYVTAVLRVICEPSAAAYYACQICPFTESVRGKAATADFAARIRTDHRATCPGLHQKGTAA